MQNRESAWRERGGGVRVGSNRHISWKTPTICSSWFSGTSKRLFWAKPGNGLWYFVGKRTVLWAPTNPKSPVSHCFGDGAYSCLSPTSHWPPPTCLSFYFSYLTGFHPFIIPTYLFSIYLYINFKLN